jgi:hypothetical protein
LSFAEETCHNLRHMRPKVIITFAAILLATLVSRGADTLPATLSDQEFWKLITDFSEPGGDFTAFEMYMSNEETFQEILPDLLRRVQPGGVYLGVAPEQNFTYIAALRPKMAFIVDIRRENMVEMLMYKALFEMAPNRAEFLSRFFSRPLRSTPPPQAGVDQVFAALAQQGSNTLLAQNVQAIKDRLQKTHGYVLTPRDLQTIDRIAGLFFRNGPDAHLTTYGTTYRELMRVTDGQGRNRNFLASDPNYQFVREMHQKNLIVPVVGDFAGPRALQAIARYLRQHAAEVSVFYVSNVEEYIQSPAQTWTAYCRNIATLPINASSMFIRFGRGGRGSFLGPMPGFAASCPR